MRGEYGYPVIIEVRVNESWVRTDNPHLPYGPQEVIDEACRAWEAGASILHWHGRHPVTGEADNRIETYLQVVEGVRARTDLLLHPTLGYINQQDPQERTKHVLAVAGDPALRVDLAPVDFGSLNLDHWDPGQQTFTSWEQVYANTRGRLRDVLTILRGTGTAIAAVVWDAGQIRTARAFQAMELLGTPYWELTFTGATMPVGTAPTLPGLQALLAELPPHDPWTVLCWNGDVLPVAAWALTMGGHVSVGLGDWHYRHLGIPGHAELVRRVSDMAWTLGRPTASPARTRELLGLPTRADLPARHRQDTP